MIPWEAARAGLEPAAWTLGPITRTDIVRYQGASGDFQPIHHDEPFARAAGYDAPLVVGMFPAGVLASWATAWLGRERVRKVRIRWRDRVWPGDMLTCRGSVVQRREAERQVDLEIDAVTGAGAVAVQVWMTFEFTLEER